MSNLLDKHGRLRAPTFNAVKSKRPSSDARWPYRLGILLLYGRVEAITITSPWMRVLNYSKLKNFVGFISATNVHKHLLTLVEMGVLEYVQHHGTYAVLKIRPPLDVETNSER